mmetsp:Transcript_8406/g.52572  ORF Transcript_8406/g.52572 Transcript_8406/m.52572 type:complete len:233 (+) Transcript_8406:2768-3466(+)
MMPGQLRLKIHQRSSEFVWYQKNGTFKLIKEYFYTNPRKVKVGGGATRAPSSILFLVWSAPILEKGSFAVGLNHQQQCKPKHGSAPIPHLSIGLEDTSGLLFGRLLLQQWNEGCHNEGDCKECNSERQVLHKSEYLLSSNLLQENCRGEAQHGQTAICKLWHRTGEAHQGSKGRSRLRHRRSNRGLGCCVFGALHLLLGCTDHDCAQAWLLPCTGLDGSAGAGQTHSGVSLH